MHCNICGRKSEKRICEQCAYLLNHGADEETIKKMHSDEKTKKIWKDNEKRAEDLAHAYYDSVLDMYDEKKKKPVENFGFNTFADGIRVGLDIVMPLLDEETQEKAKHKIEDMVKKRSNIKTINKNEKYIN